MYAGIKTENPSIKMNKRRQIGTGAGAKPAATVTPAPASKVPYLVRVGSGVQIYKAPAGAVAKTCPYGVYTIVEERNGYGKLKSGAGWLKLSAVAKV